MPRLARQLLLAPGSFFRLEPPRTGLWALFVPWHTPCFAGERMNVSLYQAAAAMHANMRWQEVIADNLAASSMPGARRREVSFEAVRAGLAPAEGVGSSQHSFIPAARTQWNLRQGTLRATGLNTDTALEGPGYFEVKLPNGHSAFTRDGEFHFNAAGQLVTKQGYPVMGTSGELALDPNHLSSLAISSMGDISQAGEVKGRMRVVEFADPGGMESLGSGYYAAAPGTEPSPASSTMVRQGFLEDANIQPTLEMATMLTAMRMFEANQQVLQAQDERMGKLINDLGNPA